MGGPENILKKLAGHLGWKSYDCCGDDGNDSVF
jgi:hypothetical protein